MTYLENVKAFVVDHPPTIPQQLHAYLEVVARVDIGRHYIVVGTIEQYFAQELD